jgi:hypothetical protein
MIDPIPLGCVGLDEATMQLAAVICDEQLRNVGRRFSEDYDPAKGNPAEEQWSKRELAIWKLHETLRDGVLDGYVRDPDTGELFRLSGTDWHSLRPWRETIISGFVRAWPGDLLVRHEGRRVLLSAAEFAHWLKVFRTVVPSSVANLPTLAAPAQPLSPAVVTPSAASPPTPGAPDQRLSGEEACAGWLVEPPPLAAPAEPPAAPVVAPKGIELPSQEQEPAAPRSPDQVTQAERRKWQRDRVTEVLKEKLYPPDGRAPTSVSTALVRKQVIKAIEPECRKLGIGDPSWDTVNRALGRAKPRAGTR